MDERGAAWMNADAGRPLGVPAISDDGPEKPVRALYVDAVAPGLGAKVEHCLLAR